jgi:hypothetical protein
MTNPKSIIRLDFVEGTTILEALSEMKDKVIKLNVAYTTTILNGVQIFINQNSHIGKSFEMYQEAVTAQKAYIIC